MFITYDKMTDKQKQILREMDGNLVAWIYEGRGIGYMSEKLNLSPQQTMENIYEIAYVCLKEVGLWRFIKWTLYKRSHKKG